MMNQKGEKERRLGAQGRKTGKEKKGEFLKLKTLKNLKEEEEEGEVARIGEEIGKPRAAIPILILLPNHFDTKLFLCFMSLCWIYH